VRTTVNRSFPTLSAVITVSSLALLAFIGFALMEFRFFLEKWIPGPTAAMLEALVVLLIAGGWIRALLVAASGRRGALTALLAFSALGALIGLYDMQYVLNTPMPWPEQITVVFMLIASIAAAVVVARYRGLTKNPS
jgi:hypothetical protein